MPTKRLDPLSALIVGALIFIILISGYLFFALQKIRLIKSTETVIFASTEITGINPNLITTNDTSINITDATKIQRAVSIPFSAQKNINRHVSSTPISTSDLRPGDIISIATRGDGVTVISWSPTTTAFNGIVTHISSRTITINSLLPSTQNTIYTVTLPPESEITTPKNAQPVEISLSQIKEGDRVNVYTNDDITRTTNLTALKLDLIPPIY